MKIDNLNPPGEPGAAAARGYRGRRGGSTGPNVSDVNGNEVVHAAYVVFDGALVTELDDDTALVTFGSSNQLVPEATVTLVKDTGNPTFNFDAIPESIVKVGSTYYASYQNFSGTPAIRLASATDRDGPWTALGAEVSITDIPWANSGAGDIIYAPEIMENDGTYYIFFSVVVSSGATNSRNAIGVATATTVTGPYTVYPTAILEPGAASSPTSRRVGEPSVIYHGGQWIMAFMGEDEDLGYQDSEQVFIATAAAPTGPWTVINSGNPVIPIGASGTWTDELVADPYIFYLNGYLWIWAAGSGTAAGNHMPWENGLWYASPTDLTTWTEVTGNPLLTVGASGAWDEGATWRGSIWVENGEVGGVYGGSTPALAATKGGNFRMTIVGVEPDPTASDVLIADSGGYFTGSDIESALQELAADIAVLNAGGLGHWEVIVAGTAPPVAVSNEAEDDWLYGFVPD